MSNKSENRTCPKCGVGISLDAPQGLCPRCLLEDAALTTDNSAAPKEKPRPPSMEELNAAFPHLMVTEFIGQGGMGFVFKARQPKLERDVALKILPQSLAEDPAFAERFAREGRMLAKLNHPNIVTIYDFGEAGGYFYLLMEFVDGVNLRQAMRASRFTPEQALSIVPSVCEALQFAHDEGVLHRDIKPENILLDTKGRVKIADFGIAKFIEGRAGSRQCADTQGTEGGALGETRPASELTQAGSSLGTPQYMAPEQIERPGEVDHRADIYSLGVVFYELLTGELPSGDIAPPSSKTRVNPQVDEVVLRALEKERERRQSSATELKTQVETIVSTPDNSQREKPPTEPSAHPEGETGLTSAAKDETPPGNPWPRRAFWLVAAFVGTPALSFMAMLFLPQAARQGIGKAEAALWLGCVAVVVAVAVALPIMALWALRRHPADTANPWPRRIVLMVCGAIVIPVALFVSALVFPYLAMSTNGDLPAGLAGEARFGPVMERVLPEPAVGTFIAHLPRGGGIELVAITQPPYENQWWRPDGTFAGHVDFKMMGSRPLPQEGSRIHEFVLRLADPPNGSSLMVIKVPHSNNRASGSVQTTDGYYLDGYQWFSVEMPEEITTTNVQVGVAVDQWEPVYTRSGTGGMSGPVTWKNEQFQVSWLETDRGAERGIVQTMSHNLDREANQQRVVAILKDGTETTGNPLRL